MGMTKAIQIEKDSKLLNSRDCFILKITNDALKNKFFIWYGKLCKEVDKKKADEVLHLLKKNEDEIVRVMEKEENDDFWVALGSFNRPDDYLNEAFYLKYQYEPKLFYCSTEVNFILIF